MKDKITITMSPIMASALQRMLVDEIDNQTQWKKDDDSNWVRNQFRDEIINECKVLQEQLEEQGVVKHFKCY